MPFQFLELLQCVVWSNMHFHLVIWFGFVLNPMSISMYFVHFIVCLIYIINNFAAWRLVILWREIMSDVNLLLAFSLCLLIKTVLNFPFSSDSILSDFCSSSSYFCSFSSHSKCFCSNSKSSDDSRRILLSSFSYFCSLFSNFETVSSEGRLFKALLILKSFPPPSHWSHEFSIISPVFCFR